MRKLNIYFSINQKSELIQSFHKIPAKYKENQREEIGVEQLTEVFKIWPQKYYKLYSEASMFLQRFEKFLEREREERETWFVSWRGREPWQFFYTFPQLWRGGNRAANG